MADGEVVGGGSERLKEELNKIGQSYKRQIVWEKDVNMMCQIIKTSAKILKNAGRKVNWKDYVTSI